MTEKYTRIVTLKTKCVFIPQKWAASRLFTPDTMRKLQIFGGNSHPFAVQAHKVCVLEQAHQIDLGSLMQSSQSIGLESQFHLDIVGDFTDESGKWQLWDQVVSLPCLPGDSSSSGLLHGVPRLLASRVGCLKNQNIFIT